MKFYPPPSPDAQWREEHRGRAVRSGPGRNIRPHYAQLLRSDPVKHVHTGRLAIWQASATLPEARRIVAAELSESPI